MKTFFKSVRRKVWFVAFTLPFIIVYLLMSSLLGVVIVSGDSMNPAYENGDLLLTVQTGYIPDYNDVLVCNGSNYPILKRVIGKPGDIIDTENNFITVNGVKTEISSKERTIRLPHTVEPDSYFLVGDNSSVSHDSRYEVVGDIHKSQIIGKVILNLEEHNEH